MVVIAKITHDNNIITVSIAISTTGQVIFNIVFLCVFSFLASKKI